MDKQTPNYSANERRVLFVILLFSYFSSGMTLFLFGPVWPELTFVYQSNGEAMKMGHIASIAGGVLGVLACTPLTWYLNRPLLIAVTVLAQAISITLMPLQSFTWFRVHFTILGFMNAISKTLSMVWILELWRGSSKLNLATQLSQLVFAASSFTSSFIVKPFLPDQNQRMANLTTQEITVLKIPDASNVHKPMLIIGVIMAISAALLVPVCIRELTKRKKSSQLGEIQSANDLELQDKGANLRRKTTPDLEDNHVLESGPAWAKWSVVGFMVFFIANLAGYSLLNASYLMTFLISTRLRIPNDRATLINAAYGIASVGGILIAMPIGMFVRPIYSLLFTVTLMFLSSWTFYNFYETSELAMLMASILYGLGIATSYAGMLGILSALVKVTNLIGSLLIFGGLIGGAFFVQLFGGKIDHKPVLMPVVTMFASACMFITVLVVSFMTALIRPKRFVNLML